MICGYCRQPVIFAKKDYTKIATQEHGEAFYHGNPVHVGSCANLAITGGLHEASRNRGHSNNAHDLAFPCGSLGEPVQLNLDPFE